MATVSTHSRPRPRGATLFEALVAGSLGALLLVAVTPFFRLNRHLWQSTLGDADTQRTAQSAGHEIARHVRLARAVIVEQSDSGRLTLQLPRLDAAGRLVVPLQNGDVVSYYRGTAQGAAAPAGPYLWRAVNGQPDTRWSAPQGRLRFPLTGLSFTYFPSAAPASVSFVLTTSDGGTPARTFTSSQEAVLRNRGSNP